MSKLFKKSLAFCVAIAMVFTLFAGTISVNAEDAEETLTVNLVVDNTRVAADAAQAVLPVHVTCSADTSINVLRLIITTTAGKVSNVVSAAATEDYTIYYNGDYALLNAGQTVEDLGGFNAAELLVTVDLNEDLTEEAYAITIDARSENAADANENALKISYETAYILLPHTHTMSETYLYDDNGHWLACTSEFCDVVGGYTTEVAEHVWENNGDAVAPDCVDTLEQPVICNTCGATKTVNVDPVGHDYEYTNNGETHSAVCKNNAEHVITDEAHTYVEGTCACGATEVTECAHEYDDADNENFVNFTAAGIEHYEVCTLCGENVITSVDTSADAITVAAKALEQSYVSAINVDAAGTYSFDVEQTENIKFAYVKGDKLIANGYHSSLNDNDATSNGENGENAFDASCTNGTVEVVVEFPGIFVAFIPKDNSKLPTANIGMTSTFELGSSIAFSFKVNYTNLTNFEDVYAIVHHQKYDGNDALPIEDYRIDEYEDDGVKFFVFTYPIAAKEMGDLVNCSYYGVLDGVDYLLRQKVNYNLAVYAGDTDDMGYQTPANENKSAELKTLLSTMFTYGAEAQEYFDYHEDVLVTSDPLIAPYIAQYPALVVDVSTLDIVNSESWYLNDSDRLCGFTKSLNCNSTVEAYYKVNLTKFINKGYDKKDLEFILYYQKASDDGTENYQTETFTTDTADVISDDQVYYTFNADKIPASMMHSKTMIEMYYKGDLVASSTYSINYYFNDNINGKSSSSASQGLKDICVAIGSYGRSARTYFLG